MPRYDYKCDRCNERYEFKHGMKEEPVYYCKTCGQELKQLLSESSFILKGSGWYCDVAKDKNTDK